jgi:hypothetical protein
VKDFNRLRLVDRGSLGLQLYMVDSVIMQRTSAHAYKVKLTTFRNSKAELGYLSIDLVLMRKLNVKLKVCAIGIPFNLSKSIKSL